MHRTLVIFLAVPSRAVNESSSEGLRRPQNAQRRHREGLGRPEKARESQRWSVKAREGPRRPEKTREGPERAREGPEKARRRPLGPSQNTVICCKGSLAALIPSSILLIVMPDLPRRSDNNNEI